MSQVGMRKLILYILLFGFLLPTLNGCGEAGKCARINKQMVEYMNQKYDDTFTLVEISYQIPEGENGGIMQIYVSSEKYPDARICVVHNPGKGTYWDNYLVFKYEQETRAELEEILEEVFPGRYILSYDLSHKAFAMQYSTNDMTFEEFIAEPSSYIEFQAVVESGYSPEQEESIEAALEEAFVSRGFCCSYGLIMFDGGDGHFEELLNMEFDWVNGDSLPGQLVYYRDYEYYDRALRFEMDSNEGFSKGPSCYTIWYSGDSWRDEWEELYGEEKEN